jgi:hypothetical protein
VIVSIAANSLYLSLRNVNAELIMTYTHTTNKISVASVYSVFIGLSQVIGGLAFSTLLKYSNAPYVDNHLIVGLIFLVSGVIFFILLTYNKKSLEY